MTNRPAARREEAPAQNELTSSVDGKLRCLVRMLAQLAAREAAGKLSGATAGKHLKSPQMDAPRIPPNGRKTQEKTRGQPDQ